MRSTLILSEPVFDAEKFRIYASKILSPRDRVFVINYANEPTMLKMRFNRIGGEEINNRHYKELAKKLESFGIPASHISFSHDNDTRLDFLSNYHKSDVLIFCGGAPENLLDKLERLSVTDLIRGTEKAIIAYSAGAEVLLDNLLLL